MTDTRATTTPPEPDLAAPRFGMGDQLAYQQYQQRNRKLLWGIFALLLLLAAGVFLLLPRYIAPVEQAERIVVVEPSTGGPASSSLSPFEEAQLLRQREAAQNTLAELLELQEQLEALSVQRWAAQAHGNALSLAREGDTAYREQRFSEADTFYGEGLEILRKLDNSRQQRYDDLIAEGNTALADGDAGSASEAFALALLLQPGDAAALAGQQSAAVLNEVLSHLASGRTLHAQGSFDAAREAYQQALGLDAAHADALAALQQVDRDIEQRAYADAMSRGYAALRDDNPEAATQAFRDAEAMRPDSEEVQVALQQAADQLSTRIINRHMEAARVYEEQEDWHAAVDEWNAAVAVDPNLVVADRGLRRSLTRLDLDIFFTAVLQDPLRLVENGIFEQTRQLLVDIQQINQRGPRLQEQVASVEALMAEARVPVPVTLLSDGQTAVTVYRIGAFGAFTSKTLDLAPGHYVAVGVRPGYRDVRQEFTVEIGASTLEPLSIVCTEVI
ncbi:MAG TPA: hypothetical protein GX696_06175 [Pseudomonadaceae bacterium]|nr:hypothetical protein [Pseudomonadaceae bacterium]